MDRQSVVCHTCTGVLPATDSRTYTAQRGRLIVSNGYCACPPAAQQPAAQDMESGTHRQPQQSEQQQPMNQPASQGMNQGVMAGT
jgi:hypothetical protein